MLVGMPFAQALGGAERQLRLLALRAPAAGMEVHVVFHASGPLERELAAAGVPTSVVPLGRFRDAVAGVRAAGALRRLIRERRPDLVLGWLPRSQVYLAPAAMLAGQGRRLAWWQHHTGEGEERLVRAVTALPARGIVCTSAAVARHQAEVRPRRRLVVCHPGVEPPADVAPVDLGIPRGRVVVGLPGRLVPWKGADRLLEALSLLRQRGHDVHGLIVGGDAYELAPAYARDLRLLADPENTTFTGHVDDPSGHIRAMDVLVNASDEEPFGLTLVEGMAAGVPVVAVDSGGPAEIVEDGRSGVLVPDGSPAALASGIERALQARDRLVEGGRERYLSRFTAAAFVARAAETLRGLI